MNILHINTSQEGGASWCAIRICKALGQQGIDCKMLFAEGNAPSDVDGAIAKKDRVVRLRKYKLFRKFVHLIMRLPWCMNAEKLQKQLNAVNTKHLYLHQPLSEYRNIAQHPLVKWADVIHLHWVPDFVDYPSFFAQVHKPIVWTMHDKYPLVGVQHYCSEFSPVPEELQKIDQYCRRIKRKSILKAKNLHLVAISQDMLKLSATSDVAKGIPCTLIHNGVDTDIFHPVEIDRKSVLSHYTNANLTPDAKLFMFSAYGIWDDNKGLQRVIDALEQLDVVNKALLVVGDVSDHKQPVASFPIITTGLIKDQSELAQLYSAADYFIQASYEESFGQTPLEAMACGTPVISTPCGVSPELIRPFNGILCKGYDSAALADGIKNALANTYDADTIRQYIMDEYAYDKIAQQYIQLYHECGILNIGD